MGVTKGTRNVVIKLGSPYALRLEFLSFLSSPELLNSRPRFDPQDQMDLLKFLGETLDLPLNDMNAAQESVYIRNRNSVADDIKGWAKVRLVVLGVPSSPSYSFSRPGAIDMPRPTLGNRRTTAPNRAR